MREVHRQIVLSRNMHRFLMYALRFVRLGTGHPDGDVLKKLQNVVKFAKLVVWDTEAKNWVSVSEEERENHIAEQRHPRD